MLTSEELYERYVMHQRADISDTVKQLILSAITIGRLQAINECINIVNSDDYGINRKLCELINQVK